MSNFEMALGLLFMGLSWWVISGAGEPVSEWYPRIALFYVSFLLIRIQVLKGEKRSSE
tara:strand:- start:422 stop:595 length:174 start_codon:yes stop_codon:yes gene_type:complete